MVTGAKLEHRSAIGAAAASAPGRAPLRFVIRRQVTDGGRRAVGKSIVDMSLSTGGRP